MSYSQSNPPRKILDAGLNGTSIWFYKSGDAHTTTEAPGYYTDGSALGMQLDDIVFVQRTGTVELTMHVVTAIAAIVGTGVAKDAARAVTISAATLA